MAFPTRTFTFAGFIINLPLDKIKPLIFKQKNIVQINVDQKNKKSMEQALYLIRKSCQSFLIVEKELDEEGFMIMNLIMKSLKNTQILFQERKLQDLLMI